MFTIHLEFSKEILFVYYVSCNENSGHSIMSGTRDTTLEAKSPLFATTHETVLVIDK